MRNGIVAFVLGVCQWAAHAQGVVTGEIKGHGWVHTPESLNASVLQGDLCLPAAVTGAGVACGKYKDMLASAAAARTQVPTVLFLHGSSGLGLKAIGEWQRWLAGLGYASLAPDSFALPGRITYTSPISKSDYERLHAMRASEIAPALSALQTQPWVDARRLVLAGASEGAVPVARHHGAGFSARLVYAWSCEDNYFVQSAQSAFSAAQPVLNVISAVDPYFSAVNSWLGLASPKGHCGAALAGHPRSAVVLVPDAPHTLLNMPAAQSATAGFLQLVVGAHAR